jgi:hypothetical protein
MYLIGRVPRLTGDSYRTTVSYRVSYCDGDGLSYEEDLSMSYTMPAEYCVK